MGKGHEQTFLQRYTNGQWARCSISSVISEMQKSKPQWETWSYTSIRMEIIKKSEHRVLDEDVEKPEPSYIAGGNVECLQVKCRTITWSRNSTPRYVPKKLKTVIQADTCPPMFTAA